MMEKMGAVVVTAKKKRRHICFRIAESLNQEKSPRLEGLKGRRVAFIEAS
jgi:hypothetical protein